MLRALVRQNPMPIHMSTRQKSSNPQQDGRRPAGQAGTGAKSAMEEMLRRSGKQPNQAQSPKSAQRPSRHDEKK